MKLRKKIVNSRTDRSPRPPASHLRLADWARLRTTLIWCYVDAPALPQYQTPTLAPLMWTVDSNWLRTYHSAWLMLEGTVEIVSVNRQVIRASAGEWVFPMSRVSHQFSRNARLMSIAFTAHWPDETPLYQHTEPLTCRAQDHPNLRRAADALARATASMRYPTGEPPQQLRVAMSLARYARLSRMTLSWIIAYDQAMTALGLTPTVVGAGDPRIVVLQERIDTMPLGEHLDESAAARSVGLSVSQLNRIFVQKTGATPRAYFQQRRLRFARDSLTQTDLPVKQIAYQLGFRQANSFSNWFEKCTGVYPRQYRRRN